MSRLNSEKFQKFYFQAEILIFLRILKFLKIQPTQLRKILKLNNETFLTLSGFAIFQKINHQKSNYFRWFYSTGSNFQMTILRSRMTIPKRCWSWMADHRINSLKIRKVKISEKKIVTIFSSVKNWPNDWKFDFFAHAIFKKLLN